MLPAREEAEKLLKEAESCNPGPWGNHSRVAAHCAEKIAFECTDMDSDKAYILGLLHDIGRKFGVRHMGHVSDGYSYMMSLGYDEVAQICLTHSFNNQTTDEYIGKFDTTDEELQMIQDTLASIVMNEYDRLIQLCDALAGAEGVLNIEDRMRDVKRRYGSYPQAKWDSNLALKKHFEEKTGKDIYEVVEKDSFRLQNIMRVLVMNCSPVRNGATAEIVHIVSECLKERYEVKNICIDDFEIGFCKGCRTCHSTAKCVQQDDVDKIIEQYEWADIIISVSPSYWADIPGQFKAFIDRCTPWCNTHEPHASLSGEKKGYAIALRTGPSMRECNRIIESIEHFYGHMEIECCDSIGLCSVEYKEAVEQRKDEIIEFCSRI